MSYDEKHTFKKRPSSTPTNDESPTYLLLHPNSQIRIEVREETNNTRNKMPKRLSTNCKRTSSNPKDLSSANVRKMNHKHKRNSEKLKTKENLEEEDKELLELEERWKVGSQLHTDGSETKAKPLIPKEEISNKNNETNIRQSETETPAQWPFGNNLQHVILPSVKKVSFFRDAYFTTPRVTHDYRPEPKPPLDIEEPRKTRKFESASKSMKSDSDTRTRSSDADSQTRGRTVFRTNTCDSGKVQKQDFIRRNIKHVAAISGRKNSPSRSPDSRKVSPMPKRLAATKSPQSLRTQSNANTRQTNDVMQNEVLGTAKDGDDFELDDIKQFDDVTDSEMTSTYEVISESSIERIGRQEGDQSLLDFRAEWNKRMNTVEKRANVAKRILDQIPKKNEREKSVVRKLHDIMESLGSMKHDMTELYDYFDHFDREEETLLQQMQRQLSEKKRDNKILEYKLNKSQVREFDNTKVEELEDELKLSRQVAVSLHWELQRNDENQNKIEVNNKQLRHRLVASECSQKVLTSQVSSLQNSLDQMSLHAPSRVLSCTSDDSSRNTESEMHRQIQFLKEKEDMMVKRLVDIQTERDSIKDELQQYRVQFGELAASPATGAGRHTDLKLRLKLAEDHAGLLARKVVELEMEKEGLTKAIQEQKPCVHEELSRKPSASDLQFLEDEVGALRHALEDMESDNNRLAAELIAIKSRKLHSHSSNTLSSPLNGGGIVISLSSENIRRDSFSLKEALKSAGEPVTPSQDPASSQASSPSDAGNYVRLHPLTYYRIPAGNVVSPVKPFNLTLDGAWERCFPAIPNEDVVKSPQSVTNGSLPHSDTIWNIRPLVSTMDAAVDATTPEEWEQIAASAEEDIENYMSEEDSKSSQCKDGRHSGKDNSISCDSAASLIVTNPINSQDVILEEMKKQIACVRNIAENMDMVVGANTSNVQGKSREILSALLKRSKENAEFENNVESISEESKTSGNPPKNNSETGQLLSLSPVISRACSNLLHNSFTKNRSRDTLGSDLSLLVADDLPSFKLLSVLDVVVIMVVIYLLVSSLSVTSMMKITFLLGLFFIL